MALAKSCGSSSDVETIVVNMDVMSVGLIGRSKRPEDGETGRDQNVGKKPEGFRAASLRDCSFSLY